jgi:hypothetical protein
MNWARAKVKEEARQVFRQGRRQYREAAVDTVKDVDYVAEIQRQAIDASEMSAKDDLLGQRDREGAPGGACAVKRQQRRGVELAGANWAECIDLVWPANQSLGALGGA